MYITHGYAHFFQKNVKNEDKKMSQNFLTYANLMSLKTELSYSIGLLSKIRYY